MVSALREAGLEVARQGQHYLTAADPDSGGKWRLKGAIYEQEFQRERLTSASPEEERAGAATDRDDGSEPAQRALREVEGDRRERAVYHRARYEDLEKAIERGGAESLGGTDRGGPVDLSGHLRRELGSDAVVFQPHPKPHRDEGRVPGSDRRATPHPGAAQGDDVGRGSPRGRGGEEVRSCCPRGRSRIRPRPWAGGLPSGYQASEGAL